MATKTIGENVINQSYFYFGAFRYVVERTSNSTVIYKFMDLTMELRIGTVPEVISDDEVKDRILKCTIPFKMADAWKYSEYFTNVPEVIGYKLSQKRVEHGYKECTDCERCPHCGEYLGDMTTDPFNAVDSFNFEEFFNGDLYVDTWEDIYECPNCGKRFYIEESN